MSESTFKQTGLTELRKSIEQFPDTVTRQLRRLAQGAANGVLVAARRRLLAADPPLKGPRTMTGAMAQAITIEEDAANKQFIVKSAPPAGAPSNITIWRENGTIHQPARPYMRPAADDAKDRYRKDMELTAISAAREAFGE